MTAPATVPLVGKINLRQTSKEQLLDSGTRPSARPG